MEIQKQKPKMVYVNPDNLVVEMPQEILCPLICQICMGIVRRPAECEKC
jgi:hypothetical protein